MLFQYEYPPAVTAADNCISLVLSTNDSTLHIICLPALTIMDHHSLETPCCSEQHLDVVLRSCLSSSSLAALALSVCKVASAHRCLKRREAQLFRDNLLHLVSLLRSISPHASKS